MLPREAAWEASGGDRRAQQPAGGSHGRAHRRLDGAGNGRPVVRNQPGRDRSDTRAMYYARARAVAAAVRQRSLRAGCTGIREWHAGAIRDQRRADTGHGGPRRGEQQSEAEQQVVRAELGHATKYNAIGPAQ